MVLETSKQPHSLSDIRSLTQSTFHHYPCLWQAKTVEAILKRDRDVVIIAGTGMGKTLTFWMPLLFFPVGYIQVVITPLHQENVPFVFGHLWCLSKDVKMPKTQRRCVFG